MEKIKGEQAKNIDTLLLEVMIIDCYRDRQQVRIAERHTRVKSGFCGEKLLEGFSPFLIRWGGIGKDCK